MITPHITYTIAMPKPHTHLYELQIDVPGLREPYTDFVLPSWTPGSYMIREYARHVQAFTAEANGIGLPWHKVAKDTWRVATKSQPQITVRYQIYAYELTVRTSHLDGSHGYFNGTTVFMYIPGRTNESISVQIETPEQWQVATGLEPTGAPHLVVSNTAISVADKQPSRFTMRRWPFTAHDYDELVDCPVECGTHRLLAFDVDGIKHQIALWGHGNEDEERIVADTQKIVETQRDLFGGLPYKHYTFILHLVDGRGGGLEHRNSVTNMVDRWTFQPQKSYERFLALQSHEFFHIWNVKRIRAEPLGPFDYRHENYTRLLWAMEGITSYYDELLLVRAGLMTPERYLEKLADEILNLQSQPGRHLQSLEQSSFDAWIKLYRPDENSINSSISYYLKGSLVALLLDLEIRRYTGGERSLDDVMRYLNQIYGDATASAFYAAPGIPEGSGLLAAVEEVVASADWRAEDSSPFPEFFARYISGTDELDYERSFGHAGLKLEWGYKDPFNNTNNDPAPAWLGLNTKSEDGRTLVASVRADGPAYAAGIYAGDELLALEGIRIDETRLKDRLAERAPGRTVTITLFRRDELHHVAVTLAPAPHDKLQLVPNEPREALQERIYREWLGQYEHSR